MARMSRFLVVASCALLAEATPAQQAPAMSVNEAPEPAAAPAPTKAPPAAPAPTQGPAAAPAPAPAAAPAAASSDWKPMDSTRAAQPLPAESPMSSDIQSKSVNANVPLPPPPAGTTAKTADDGVQVLDAGTQAPPPPGAAEPEVKVVGDQTGVMLEAQRKLQSDEIRQRWAQRGGSITGYEAGLGATLMYLHKDMSATAGSGAYMDMSGAGLNASARVTLYNLKAPQYETRDTSWTAFKIGGGFDIASFGVTTQFYIPIRCVSGFCAGGMETSSATMSQTSMVGTLGLMKAWGSFDSPDEWSGTAIGVEWAPTYTSTTVKPAQGDPTTSKAFNAAGLAVDFQSGSLKTLAMSTAKPAHWKVRIFLLPPVGDVPLIMTASFNASWY